MRSLSITCGAVKNKKVKRWISDVENKMNALANTEKFKELMRKQMSDMVIYGRSEVDVGEYFQETSEKEAGQCSQPLLLH